MPHTRWLFALLVLGSAWWQPAAQAQLNEALVVHVSPDGNDAWNGASARALAGGTSAGPVRSLVRAQELVRSALRDMDARGVRSGVRVAIAAGTYTLDAPLTFTPADSGTPTAPVVYKALGDGPVVVTGGVQLQPAQPPTGAGVMVFKPPVDDRLAMNGGTQLFVNGERAPLARYPAPGYWFVQQAAGVDGEDASEAGREAFIAGQDARRWLDALPAADRQSAIVHVMQSWSAGRHRLSPRPAPAGVVRIQPRARWAFLEFGLNQRWYIENVSKAFGTPGQWLWNSQGVRYTPLPGQVNGRLTAVMPLLDRLIVIKGDNKAGRWVQDLRFEGLTLKHTRLLTPPEGDFDMQAGVAIEAAVMVDSARRIAFTGCTISQVGGYGIWFRESVRDSSVSDSQISDVGAGGIKVGLPQQAPSNPDATGGNRLINNTVRQTGRLIPGAVGVWIGQSFDNVVSHNLIADTTYTAISVGWKWGTGEPTSGRNRIEANYLVNIGNGQLSDLGGIYTLGESPGTVIVGNVIENVRAYRGYGPGAWGIYNDEGSSDLRVERNVVSGTTSGGFHLHYGRSIMVQSNLFAGGDTAEVKLPSKSDVGRSVQLVDNILMPAGAAVFDAPSAPAARSAGFEGNVIASRPEKRDQDVRTAATTAAGVDSICSSGCTSAAVTLGPGAALRDRMLVNSQGQAVAWYGHTVRNAGPMQLATAALPMPAGPPQPPLAGPLALSISMGSAPEGAQPLGLRYVARGGAAGRIAVQAQTGADTGKCLMFVEGQDVGRAWEPYAYATLNHDKGRTKVQFSLKSDPGTDFIHEWRDNAKPYRTGPSVRVRNGKVEVGGKAVLLAPAGQWTWFTIEANLGAQPVWSVLVKNASGTVRLEALPPGTPGWQALNWLGFISAAAEPSATCMGDLDVTNDANR